MKTSIYFRSFFTLLVVFTFSFGGHATKWVVQVSNFQFSPASLPNVNLGDTIRWEWVSGSHTTTSTTIPAGASTWDNPINSSVTSFEYVPAVPGLFNYKCTPHASMGMTATFTVSGFIPTLTVTPSNQNVAFVVGTTNFTVTSNSSWTAVSNQAWCTVTPQGTGNGTITATYISNPNVTQRVASITVTVSGIPAQVVTVTQDGAPRQLAVSPSNQNVSTAAGSTDFTVTSNTDWTASSNQSWCTVTPSGTGNGTLTATYTDNSSGPPRVATITVNVAGLSPQTVTVSQGGTTGIANKSGNNFLIYPNPTSGAINIVPADPSNSKLDIMVTDITGRIIQHKPVNEGSQFIVDLSENMNGTYFVKITGENGTLTRKVILSK
ncbi:MAG: T9SS type A sorting domain-containing protein [Bacteroidetes bacterium]|nr:T9SS type A sorting domain-containing protein [Bacteroidota bacterium]